MGEIIGMKEAIKNLGTCELLCQLAEESSELAQAALKMRRVIDKTNPTPKTKEECEKALIEEIADVDIILKYLGYLDDGVYMKIYEIEKAKEERWNNRLIGGEMPNG